MFQGVQGHWRSRWCRTGDLGSRGNHGEGREGVCVCVGGFVNLDFEILKLE